MKWDRMNKKKLNKISKSLSYILRHNPAAAGIELDMNGYANVEELCDSETIQLTLEELEYIVENNDKKRFSFNEDKTLIRANQGHSIEVDVELEEVTPPDFLYHGTTERFVHIIATDGLKKMSRNHVHLSVDEETAINVGKRHGKPIVLMILAGEMASLGIPFYKSKNGVWLTDFVPTKFIRILTEEEDLDE